MSCVTVSVKSVQFDGWVPEFLNSLIFRVRTSGSNVTPKRWFLLEGLNVELI